MDRFSGTTSGPVPAGSTITINFENPALANQTIDVEIEGDGGDTRMVQIQLDGDGKGSTQFTLPADWTIAFLKHPTSDAHVVQVEP